MILRTDGKGCVFDVPPEILEEWENAVAEVMKDPHNTVKVHSNMAPHPFGPMCQSNHPNLFQASFILGPVMDLPDLDDPLLDSSAATTSYSTKNPRAMGRNGVRGAGGYGGGGGGGRGGYGGGRGGGRGGGGFSRGRGRF